MKDAMNAAFGQILEQANAEPEISSRISGRLGKALRAVGVAGAIAAFGLVGATPAFAQSGPTNPGGCIVGGIVGGLLGKHVGNGDGNKVAIGAGAIAGCMVGNNVASNQQNNRLPPPPRRMQQTHYPQAGSGYGGQMQPADSAPNCMAQWNGDLQPMRPLTPEAKMALDKGRMVLSQSYEQSSDAMGRYAQAEQQFRRSQDAQASAYNNMSAADTIATRDAARRADSQFNQTARYAQDVQRSHAANTIRVLDACEQAASQGQDVTAYADLQRKMVLPSADGWNVNQSRNNQNVNYDSGYEQPRSYRR